ncbi:MAG: hypothetical protein JW741_23975 [Sedimentisphaerales bacterium]|nr:hypothetical protein [Sedimentisphaerales bacterium]
MHRLKMYATFLLPIFVLVFAWAASAYWLLPPRAFRKALLDPIPPSVKRIKASIFSGWGCHKYVLRFNISERDLRLILASDQFKEIGYVEYRGNTLVSGETREATISFNLFEGWRKTFRPRWFELADSDAVKAYRVEEEDIGFHKVRLLLYDPGISQAYYVEYEARGTGVGVT